MSKKSNIKYVVGDATAPQGESKKIICHICNDLGAWGAGFVLALSKVNVVAERIGATLHMPRIGCGLAGGEWDAVQAVIEEVVTVDVTVYDLA